jgi:hypothetical protein
MSNLAEAIHQVGDDTSIRSRRYSSRQLTLAGLMALCLEGRANPISNRSNVSQYWSFTIEVSGQRRNVHVGSNTALRMGRTVSDSRSITDSRLHDSIMAKGRRYLDKGAILVSDLPGNRRRGPHGLYCNSTAGNEFAVERDLETIRQRNAS